MTSSMANGNIRKKPWESEASLEPVNQDLSMYNNGLTEKQDNDLVNVSSGYQGENSVSNIYNHNENIGAMSLPYNNGLGYNGYNGHLGYNNGYFNNDLFGSDYRSMYGPRYGGMFGNSYGFQYGNIPATGNMTESTQATFMLLENIVGTFTSFAQMLESTYMVTHNSFFSLISVAEQFGMIKETLGSVFGIFKVMNILKGILAIIRREKIEGRTHNELGNHDEETPISLQDSVFQDQNDDDVTYKNSNTPQHSSKKRIPFKPFFYLIITTIALPIITRRLAKLMKVYLRSRKLNGFAMLKYDYIPENTKLGYPLRKHDIVSITDGYVSNKGISNWLKVKNQEGKSGVVPSSYVDILKKTQST